MGLMIDCFTLKQIREETGDLEAWGRPRVSRVKRDAQIGEAASTRDAAIAEAKAHEEGAVAQSLARTRVAEAEAEQERKRLVCEAEVSVEKAQTELAYALKKAEMNQALAREQVKVEIARKEAEGELRRHEITLRESTLEAEIVKPAEAAARRRLQEADAERKAQLMEVEAIRERGRVEAEACRLRGLAEADSLRARGISSSPMPNGSPNWADSKGEQGLEPRQSTDAFDNRRYVSLPDGHGRLRRRAPIRTDHRRDQPGGRRPNRPDSGRQLRRSHERWRHRRGRSARHSAARVPRAPRSVGPSRRPHRTDCSALLRCMPLARVSMLGRRWGQVDHWHRLRRLGDEARNARQVPAS